MELLTCNLRTEIYSAPNPADRIIMEVWDGAKCVQAVSGLKDVAQAKAEAAEFINRYTEIIDGLNDMRLDP